MKSIFHLHHSVNVQAHGHRKRLPPRCLASHGCVALQASSCLCGIFRTGHSFPSLEYSLVLMLCLCRPLASPCPTSLLPVTGISLLFPGPLYRKVTDTRAWLSFSLIVLIWTVYNIVSNNIQQSESLLTVLPSQCKGCLHFHLCIECTITL